MTMPPVIRIFFAIDLPESIKSQVASYITSLKKHAKTQGIRWTRPENLHITLQFLPEVQTIDLEQLVNHVRQALAGQSFLNSAVLGGPILFPNPFHPRVIVLDVEPQCDLAALSQHVGLGITKMSYALDERPFKAHVTLGRLKHPQSTKLDFLKAVDTPPFLDVPVNEVSLFRSAPTAEGSHYTCIDKLVI